ncbi:endonuclease toxin domain-containing protein, partial [[Clostridium] polysaccharolyticum]
CNAVKYANDIVYSKENVWEKPAVVRGNEIDELLGNNLGHNFPVIDKIENRTITSFKSIDLTLKSYQDKNKLYGQLARNVRQLEGFSGKVWSEQEVLLKDYDAKVLQIAISKAIITGEQKLAFDAVKLYAKEKGIKIIVTVVTNK